MPCTEPSLQHGVTEVTKDTRRFYRGWSFSSSRPAQGEPVARAVLLPTVALAASLMGCVASGPSSPPPGRGSEVVRVAAPPAPAPTIEPVRAGEAVSSSVEPGTEKAPPVAPSSAEAPAAPVERFDPTLPTKVPVAGDLVAEVAHGAVGNRSVIVYLHGVCGDVHKFRAWTEAAVHFGTVVAVRGDDKCKDAGRYKWGFGTDRTDRRILAALRAVSAVRSVPLDLEAITLVGYSQGSARAEALVRAFPSRYRRAVLVAGPKEHASGSFHDALGVAIVAGGKDLKTHLRDSAAKAAKVGVRARYFELPGARHGEYGESAVRVMGAALTWVFGDSDSPKAAAR